MDAWLLAEESARRMPAIYEHTVLVVPSEIDGLGHVNNVEYVRWMQAAAVAHSAAQGWPHQAYVELGAGWVVRSHQIEYLQPAHLGDRIVIKTWVATMRKVTSLRRYEMLRYTDDPATGTTAGTLVARGETDWAFIDFQTRQPRRIAPEVQQCFELVADPTP
ncbi:MAG: acyl-CoA thioesterase [Planctomycetaceae bacterium]